MILLQITELKAFMGKLLAGELFDTYLLKEASVTTYNTFLIDGTINTDFFTQDELEEDSSWQASYTSWKKIRPLCFELIKGKRTPLRFKFILHLKEEEKNRLLTESDTTATSLDIQSFVAVIKYDGSVLTISTATAYRTFLPDKSADGFWDRYMIRFLSQNEIAFDNLSS